jgi:hypothetical protein
MDKEKITVGASATLLKETVVGDSKSYFNHLRLTLAFISFILIPPMFISPRIVSNVF